MWRTSSNLSISAQIPWNTRRPTKSVIHGRDVIRKYHRRLLQSRVLRVELFEGHRCSTCQSSQRTIETVSQKKSLRSGIPCVACLKYPPVYGTCVFALTPLFLEGENWQQWQTDLKQKKIWTFFATDRQSGQLPVLHHTLWHKRSLLISSISRVRVGW